MCGHLHQSWCGSSWTIIFLVLSHVYRWSRNWVLAIKSLSWKWSMGYISQELVNGNAGMLWGQASHLNLLTVGEDPQLDTSYVLWESISWPLFSMSPHSLFGGLSPVTLNESGIGARDFFWRYCICSLFSAHKILGSTTILIVCQKLSLKAKLIYGNCFLNVVCFSH